MGEGTPAEVALSGGLPVAAHCGFVFHRVGAAEGGGTWRGWGITRRGWRVAGEFGEGGVVVVKEGRGMGKAGDWGGGGAGWGVKEGGGESGRGGGLGTGGVLGGRGVAHG